MHGRREPIIADTRSGRRQLLALAAPPVTAKVPLVPRWYTAFKLTLFLLLAVDAVLFALDGTAAEGLDSVAWFVLLLLFELETAHAGWIPTRRAAAVVHAVRFAAGVAVVLAWLGYIREQAWLDTANAGLWLAVVVLLEFKVRFGRGPAAQLAALDVLPALLYLSLGGLVLVWAWRGEWFDAYDAALWLLAFATIEMNLLRAKGTQPVPRHAPMALRNPPR